MHVVIPSDLKREFKSTCVLEEVNMSQVVCELIQEWLKKREVAQRRTANEPVNH
ncbi:MAG TPA: hypothetical protein VIQ31_31180 [Phormidium sp.]